MRNQKPWQVRVVRAVEEWVTVFADSSKQAEELAAVMPKVLSVFGGSVIRGDKPIDQISPIGVEEGDD